MSANTNLQESLYGWLVLCRAPGIGPKSLQKLLTIFPDPCAVLRAGVSHWSDCGLKEQSISYLVAPDRQAIEKDICWQEEPANHIITLQDPRYPVLLRGIPDPPPVLFIHGSPDVLSLPQLAIVGSRNPTPSGSRTAREFARHLATSGLAITSGLALGIDADSHLGALEAGGRTLAVMGTGLDRVYPSRHRELAHAIAGNGALVSEFPTGTAPLPANFPRRNRIISGLSTGTLVVEAAPRSGSLITARFAADQGREVFAIPGSIHNPLARGCHALIRQGAKLVETAEDIMEELGGLAAACTQAMPDNTREQTLELDEEYRQLLDIAGYDPFDIDTIVKDCGLTAAAVSSMLLILELNGYVVSSSGGRYIRIDREGQK